MLFENGESFIHYKISFNRLKIFLYEFSHRLFSHAFSLFIDDPLIDSFRKYYVLIALRLISSFFFLIPFNFNLKNPKLSFFLSLLGVHSQKRENNLTFIGNNRKHAKII
jgi:hypothetical protein